MSVLLARLLVFALLCAAPVGQAGVAPLQAEEDESAHLEKAGAFSRHGGVTQPPPPPRRRARRAMRVLRRPIRRPLSLRPPPARARTAGRTRRAVLYGDGDNDDDDDQR